MVYDAQVASLAANRPITRQRRSGLCTEMPEFHRYYEVGYNSYSTGSWLDDMG